MDSFESPEKVYVIGSLRHPAPRDVAHSLRLAGFDVFDDWQACSPDGDDRWQQYETERGRTYREALAAPFAQQAFQFDLKHLNESDIGVLIMPCGKSAHLELGWMLRGGARGYILLPDGEPERWDIMYNFATGVVYSVEELIEAMRREF